MRLQTPVKTAINTTTTKPKKSGGKTTTNNVSTPQTPALHNPPVGGPKSFLNTPNHTVFGDENQSPSILSFEKSSKLSQQTKSVKTHLGGPQRIVISQSAREGFLTQARTPLALRK